jgi:hypothetical protein
VNGLNGKPVRHILIFDNHPASLRLLRNLDLKYRREDVIPYAVLAVVLVLSVGVAMFWPLL